MRVYAYLGDEDGTKWLGTVGTTAAHGAYTGGRGGEEGRSPGYVLRRYLSCSSPRSQGEQRIGGGKPAGEHTLVRVGKIHREPNVFSPE